MFTEQSPVYRNAGQIRHGFLQLVGSGQSLRTRIANELHLSFAQRKRYEADLIANGLMVVSEDGKYHITEKGKQYLAALDCAESILKQNDGTVGVNKTQEIEGIGA